MHDVETAAEPQNHWVQFYETDAFLADTVAAFAIGGLDRGESVVVVATPAHRAAFLASLGARESGRLVMLDAEETLATFMVDGMPDRQRFMRSVGDVVGRLAATGPGLRAYGEMVDLLWRAGRQTAALALEELWNELRARHDFKLLCAYGIDSFYQPEGVSSICASHSHVLAPEKPSQREMLASNVHALVQELARRTDAEAALRMSMQELDDARADLEDFIANAAVPIHRVDADGIIRYANAAELELLGYPADEVVGHHVAEFHADAHVIADMLARLKRGETLRDFAARLRTRTGIRHVEITSNGKMVDGELATTRCFSRDITAQKQAEQDRDAIYATSQRLAKELERDKLFAALVDHAMQVCHADDAVIVMPGEPDPDRSGHELRVPLAGTNGTVQATLVLTHPYEPFSDRDRRLLAAIAAQVSPYLDNSRHYEDQLAARKAAEAAQHRTTFLHGVTTALSRALTAEEAAKTVIREARVLVGARAGGVLLLGDGGGQFIVDGDLDRDIAEQLSAMWTTEAMPVTDVARTGVPVWIVGADAIDGRYPNLRALRETAGILTWGAVPITFESRTLGALAFRCTHERPLRDGEESILLAIGRQCGQALERARLHDATQAARAEAERASRAKDEFLAMLGHELRNPLSPILTAVQLMRQRGDESSSREQNVIERQVDHLIHLVDDLLDISRITQGKVQLDKRPVRLAALVARALEIVSPLCEERRHEVAVTMPDGDIWLEADDTRLCQVLTNLLTNAAKYTPSGGRIEVSAVSHAGRVTIRVKDNGNGMSAELLPRVFDLFVQGRRDLEGDTGGLGIGLALVRNLVAMHGGTVRAASDGPGYGSELAVELPTELRHIPVPEVERKVHKRVQVTARRILVVDDNEDAGGLLGDILRSVGHEVVVAHDAPRALDAVKHFTPDVAILDIGLPVMDGYELAAALRDRMPAIRMMAVTGYGQDQDRQRAQHAGFEHHFTKPVGLAKILAAIEVDAG